MPSYRKYDSRHTIVNCIKAEVCEICEEHSECLCMHNVRTLKSLKGRDIFEKNLWHSVLITLNSYIKPENQGDSWKAVYAERCTYDLGDGSLKPTDESQLGTGGLPHILCRCIQAM